MKREVHGTTHVYSGHEANAVGVCSALLAGSDRVAGTHRGHGRALAPGVHEQALIDELLGRRTGICGGRSGSMNAIELEHGLMGCYGIVGGSVATDTAPRSRASCQATAASRSPRYTEIRRLGCGDRFDSPLLTAN